ncbi:hypothetical protein VPH35_117114 [Triticum aestivum]
MKTSFFLVGNKQWHVALGREYSVDTLREPAPKIEEAAKAKRQNPVAPDASLLPSLTHSIPLSLSLSLSAPHPNRATPPFRPIHPLRGDDTGGRPQARTSPASSPVLVPPPTSGAGLCSSRRLIGLVASVLYTEIIWLSAQWYRPYLTVFLMKWLSSALHVSRLYLILFFSWFAALGEHLFAMGSFSMFGIRLVRQKNCYVC